MAQQTEDRVARHYGQGDLERRILEALVASGKDPDHLAPADLTPVDEFHTGGREATAAFAEQAGFTAGQHLLDIGCGIGGPPPLGTHILMRDDAPQKIANAVARIESGVIAPVELVCRAG
jgi:hypothetical protein